MAEPLSTTKHVRALLATNWPFPGARWQQGGTSPRHHHRFPGSGPGHVLSPRLPVGTVDAPIADLAAGSAATNAPALSTLTDLAPDLTHQVNQTESRIRCRSFTPTQPALEAVVDPRWSPKPS